MLPDLAKRLAPGVDGRTRDLVVDIVRDVLGTDDPEEAAARTADARLSAELRLKLAGIEAEAEARQSGAEQAAREAQTARIKAELDAAARSRADDLRRIEARLADRQDARATMTGLTQADSPLAWGPVVVSTIVVAGFFATLLYLIFLVRQDVGETVEPADQLVLQIVNIAVGALTAGFATVISFWLGSSEGSRQKDSAAVRTQAAAADLQRETNRTTRDLVSEQAKQTRAILDRVARPAPAPVPSAPAPEPGKSKDARQFTRCVDIILRHEGGFVDHPADPGGATNFGITHKTLAAWRGAPVTKDDVRTLTVAEARDIYRANYWNALNCDTMPAGVDLSVFDMGVNAGVTRAAKMLQGIVHVEKDGQVGPITIGAVKAIDPEFVVDAFADARMGYYRSLRHWETFKNGWTRRTRETREAALDMLA